MSAFESCTKVDASGDIATNADMTDAAGLDDPSTTSIHNHDAIDTWLDGGIADDNGVNFEWEYGDSPSGPSSYAASIASVFTRSRVSLYPRPASHIPTNTTSLSCKLVHMSHRRPRERHLDSRPTPEAYVW